MVVAAISAGAAVALSFISELVRLRRWRNEIAPATPWRDTRCTARDRAIQVGAALVLATAVVVFAAQPNGLLWALGALTIAALPATLAVGIHNAHVIDEATRRLTTPAVKASAF